MRRCVTGCLALAAVIAALDPALPATAAPAGKKAKAAHLANSCFALRSTLTGRFVGLIGDTYRADQNEGTAATFFWKPATLRTYLPQDQGGRLLGVRADGQVGRAETPGPATEWFAPRRGRRVRLFLRDGRQLGATSSGDLILVGRRAAGPAVRFGLVRRGGCTPFPEADVGATGKPFRGTNRKGDVVGFADMHLHITSNQRAGGAVIYGEPFHPYGISEALGHDADVHGADGSADVTGNLLRTGLPFGTHDTHGWPTFAGWPVQDTITHQQTYYVWLKRAWMAGERLVVAQAVEDQPICEIEPRKTHTCDETEAVRQQIQVLRGLQGYVDAQAGAKGKGWFRLVYNPRQARQVIERGRLAVLIGIESSNLFGCSEQLDQPECTRRDIDRGIRNARRLGVRSVFPMHWTDNAFGGAALEGGGRGTFINVLQAFQTGHYFRTGPCPRPGQGEEMGRLEPFELAVLASFFPAAQPLAQAGMPVYPPGPQCNAKGLTPLGKYLIKRLIANHMLIEMDHMSEWAREAVLRIAKRRRYPLVSSHTGTGGLWTPEQLRLLYRLGGLAAARAQTAPELAARIEELKRHRSKRHYFAAGLGTDTGGFSSLPEPRADAAQTPVTYPFVCRVGGRVTFQRQRTGTRTYDLNTDGVAHYGLIADLLADMQQHGGGAALRSLFRSAEAYLRTWELAYGRKPQLARTRPGR
jgi:microsomal dipeptidase-like Zn-dependent dipeptidase